MRTKTWNEYAEDVIANIVAGSGFDIHRACYVYNLTENQAQNALDANEFILRDSLVSALNKTGFPRLFIEGRLEALGKRSLASASVNS